MGDRKEIVFLSEDADEKGYPMGLVEMPIRWSDDLKRKLGAMTARQGTPPIAIKIRADDTGMDYTFSFIWPNTHNEME